jgi:hypothetical protein
MRRVHRFGNAHSLLVLVSVLALLLAPVAQAQGAPGKPANTAPPTPQQDAPIDLTGWWVSIVNEDWRWRMLTPPKGDYASVPLNAAGKAKADSWDPAQDGSCKAVGAGGLLRMPTRLHVTWAAPDVLRIESDTGLQVRTLHFDAAKSAASGGARTLQGRSLALWEHSMPVSGGMGFPLGGPQRTGGDLKVVTTDLAEGWLRRNGVAYSDKAIVTEFFDRFPTPDGNEWFVVTTQVDDPAYLKTPFVTSSHFRREADGSRWHPRPCKG